LVGKIDADGNIIDKHGFIIGKDGIRRDKDGNIIDKDGYKKGPNGTRVD